MTVPPVVTACAVGWTATEPDDEPPELEEEELLEELLDELEDELEPELLLEEELDDEPDDEELLEDEPSITVKMAALLVTVPAELMSVTV